MGQQRRGRRPEVGDELQDVRQPLSHVCLHQRHKRRHLYFHISNSTTSLGNDKLSDNRQGQGTSASSPECLPVTLLISTGHTYKLEASVFTSGSVRSRLQVPST